MASNKFCCPHCGGKQPFKKLFFGIVDPMPCVHCGIAIRLREGYVLRFLRFLLIISSVTGVNAIEKALMNYFQLPYWSGVPIFWTLLLLVIVLNLCMSYFFATFEPATDNPQQ